MKSIIVLLRKILLLFFLPLSGFGQGENPDWWLLPSPGAGERQIPDWFLHPEPDEYVGVSLPSYSIEESALFVALLSYCAREEMKVDREESVSKLKSKGESQVHRSGILRIKDRIGIFEISRKFLNEYNELFVAVKIRKDDSVVLGLQSVWVSDSVMVNGVLKQLENSNECLGYYMDRTNKKAILCKYTDKNGSWNVVIEGTISKKEIFDLTPHYSYLNKGNTPQTGKVREQFSCKQSLGFAYLQGMLALIEKQKNVKEKAERDEVDELLGSLWESVVLRKLDYSMSVENNCLLFIIPE